MKADYSFLREMKKVHLQKSHLKIKQENSNLEVETIQGGYILPIQYFQDKHGVLGKGGVLTKDGFFVERSRTPGWITNGYECSLEEVEHGKAVFCGCFINQWGHFLLETISRLWYYVNHRDEDYIYVFVVGLQMPIDIAGNYKEFFDLLGITNQIKIINEPLRFDEVIVPSRSFHYKKFFSLEYLRILDTVVEQAEDNLRYSIEPTPNRIFLSRSHFPKANETEIGLDMLDSFFEKNGFTIIFPEQLPLPELIQIIRKAQICASESGTVAHNFLFCSDNQEVIIIERTPIVNDAQASIDVVRNLSVTYVDGNISFYTVSPGTGPFILYPTELFLRFANTKGFNEFDMKYIGKEYMLSSMMRYFNAYSNIKSIAIESHPLIFENAECILEARQETDNLLAEYLLHSQ